MKKALIIFSGLVLVVFLIGVTSHSAVADKDDCITLKDGILEDSNGNLMNTGYDKWGYNYQSHMFNGFYWNSSRPEIPWTEETLIAANKSTTWLVMKWNDTWLSNKDCNLDGKLDRGYSCDPINANSSACEGAWETNHQTGWTEVNGKKKKWTYFVKIVMVPRGEGNYVDGGYWFTADGVEIGSVLWGAYARVLQISNDPSIPGEHGVYYKSAVNPGWGVYK